MPIPATCQCGARFAAPDHLAGKAVACPKCKQPLKIPAGDQAAKAPAARQQTAPKKSPAKQPAAKSNADAADNGKIAATCQCGARFAAPPNLAGKRVACPKCKQPVQIPVGKQAAAKKAPANQATATAPKPQTQPEALPALGGGGIDDLLDEVGVEGKKTGEDYCPECGSQFTSSEALICVECGFNRKTGRQLSTVKVKPPPEKAIDLSAPPGGLKRKGSGGDSEASELPDWVRPAGMIGGIICLVLFLMTMFVPIVGFFTGILLIVFGSILANVGPIWIAVIAFQDDLTQGLLVFFIPLYLFIYVAKNWAATKLPFYIWVFGALVGMGGMGGIFVNLLVTALLFGEG